MELRFLIGFTDEPLPVDFDDYIIGNFNETYDNLYLKTGSAFEYVSKCGISKRKVTMVDDDTIFYAGKELPKDDIICGYRLNTMTEKKTTGKWALTDEQWPSGICSLFALVKNIKQLMLFSISANCKPRRVKSSLSDSLRSAIFNDYKVFVNI